MTELRRDVDDLRGVGGQKEVDETARQQERAEGVDLDLAHEHVGVDVERSAVVFAGTDRPTVKTGVVHEHIDGFAHGVHFVDGCSDR